jgi:Ca2+-binding RTX toxin-like protein
VAVALSAVTAVTAANVVSGGRVGGKTLPVTANDLKPPQCAALVLEGVAGITGSPGLALLILGTAANDRIIAGGKDDCIVAGAGNDSINAAGGTDVCIGGAGVDTFQNCERIYDP